MKKKTNIIKSSLMLEYICVALCSVALNGIAAPDLIGTWDFESGVTDVWTNNLGGTAYGSATTTNNSERGNVLWMDGSDSSSYVDVLHNSLLDLTDQITISAWFYAYNGGADILFSKGDWNKAYSTRIDDQGNDINFHGRDTTSGGVSSSSALPVGKWTHLLITFDVNAS
jgi:MSHA biogenesis protein MshQ